MNQTYMKEQKILPLLLKMSLPMVISMMVNSLYNIVDSFFVAKISENAMTALSLVFPVQNLISSVMIGFAIGINAVISFFMGAQNQKQADKAASQGMLLSCIHAVVLTVICIAGMPVFLKMFTKDAEIVSLGLKYSNIAFAFSIMLGIELMFEKVFQAVGRMNASMVCLMTGCIVNIVLDPIMIFGIGPFPAMGIEGAALATGIGQTSAAVLYIIIYIVKPIPVKFRKSEMRIEGSMAKRLYSIGMPASLSLALPSILISVLNVILAAYSAVYVFVLDTMVIYGGLMNLYSALTSHSAFNLNMLITFYVQGFPMDIVHAVSTVIFLFFGAEPMLEKLDRIKVKYGLIE